jgi:heme/copper-type cytochrome/quinol oxidase subunit 2
VRLIVLEVCIGMAALVFVLAMLAMARDRARRRAAGERPGVALIEYAWATTPWIMVAAAALPAVKMVMAAHV